MNVKNAMTFEEYWNTWDHQGELDKGLAQLTWMARQAEVAVQRNVVVRVEGVHVIARLRAIVAHGLLAIPFSPRFKDSLCLWSEIGRIVYG